MDRKRLFIHVVVLMFLMFLAFNLESKFHWYYSIWYFDMPMHFFGGVWLGLFFIYIFPFSNPLFKSILKVILWVFLIGILWELFELYTNNYVGHDSFNTLDTISDLCFDLAGGFSALFYIVKSIMPIENTGV